MHLGVSASSVSSSRYVARFTAVRALSAGAFLLLMSSGCGHHESAAARVQTPPQSLSEPVQPIERAPASAPQLPVTVDEGYAAQKPGETRALPVFEAPPPAPAPATIVAAPAPSAVAGDQRDDKGRYHVLQKGETVYALARQYNVKPQQLIAANQFRDPNRLSVGTKVYIPD